MPKSSPWQIRFAFKQQSQPLSKQPLSKQPSSKQPSSKQSLSKQSLSKQPFFKQPLLKHLLRLPCLNELTIQGSLCSLKVW